VDGTVFPTETIAPSTFAAVGGGAGQLAFASSRTGIPQIYLLDIAVNGATQITNMPNGACQPSWSPDGLKLVFISPCKGMDDIYYNASLYIINADGTGLTPVPPSPGGDFDPAWSPDGKTIAFTSLRSGQMEIFSMNVDDFTNVTQITNGAKRVESRQPSWSPDGTQIVYTVKRVGVYQIWMMDSNGENPKQIVRSGLAFNDYQPVWAPIGDLILYNQRCATAFCNPYLMSISATDRSVEQGKRMQVNVITIEHVDYSPDGFYIAYEGVVEDNNVDIFYMTAAGGGRERITTDPESDFQPAWRPTVTTP
jgi:Tol biopolymer transport system component